VGRKEKEWNTEPKYSSFRKGSAWEVKENWMLDCLAFENGAGAMPRKGVGVIGG